jgi:hypothetical protein
MPFPDVGQQEFRVYSFISPFPVKFKPATRTGLIRLGENKWSHGGVQAGGGEFEQAGA